MHGMHAMGNLFRDETMRVFRCQSGSGGDTSSILKARVADWVDDYRVLENVHDLELRRRVGQSVH